MIPSFLFNEAEDIAHRLRLDPSLLDFLYANSKHNPLPPRDEWERHVRMSTALNRVMRIEDADSFDEFFDQETKDTAFDKVRSANGLLLLTYHGGFTGARKGFLDAISNQIPLTRLGKKSIVEDQRQALFKALRSLQDGEAVIMAPDGPRGKQFEPPKVLGKTWSAGEGAAFLAEMSGCTTAWYSVGRRDRQLTLSIELGPKFERGMSSKEFSARLYQFYANMIESQFTGDPRNIVLKIRWNKILSS